MKVLIDREICSLLRPHTEEEYRGLRVELMANGCNQEFIAWFDGKNYILLDGHTRREICISERIPIKGYIVMNFPNKQQAMQWVIDHQLARRNLTKEEAAYYRAKDYLHSAKQAKPGEKAPLRSQNESAEQTTEKPGKRVAQEVAEKHGVSQATIHRDVQFAEAVDSLPPDQKAQVLAGESGKTKSEIIESALPKRKKRQPKKPKVGSVKYDLKAFDDKFGRLYRELDVFGNAFGCKECHELEAVREHFKQGRTAFLTLEKEKRRQPA